MQTEFEDIKKTFYFRNFEPINFNVQAKCYFFSTGGGLDFADDNDMFRAERQHHT